MAMNHNRQTLRLNQSKQVKKESQQLTNTIFQVIFEMQSSI